MSYKTICDSGNNRRHLARAKPRGCCVVVNVYDTEPANRYGFPVVVLGAAHRGKASPLPCENRHPRVGYRVRVWPK